MYQEEYSVYLDFDQNELRGFLTTTLRDKKYVDFEKDEIQNLLKMDDKEFFNYYFDHTFHRNIIPFEGNDSNHQLSMCRFDVDVEFVYEFIELFDDVLTKENLRELKHFTMLLSKDEFENKYNPDGSDPDNEDDFFDK